MFPIRDRQRQRAWRCDPTTSQYPVERQPGRHNEGSYPILALRFRLNFYGRVIRRSRPIHKCPHHRKVSIGPKAVD